MAENWSFALKLEHYVDDQGSTRDRSRIQFKGRELIAKIRHKSAQITKDFYFDVRPMNLEADAADADDARRVIEWETQHPQKFYSTIEEKTVIAALSGSLGVMAVDFDPFCRPSGELIFREVDPRKFGWTPGWANPHEINCPWVQEERYLRVADIKAMASYDWKNVDDVVPDNGHAVAVAINERTPRSLHERFATVLFTWYRYDATVKDEKIDPSQPVELAERDRYMACPSCGHTEDAEDGDGGTLPDINGPCPECAKNNQINLMQRVDHEYPTQQVLAYPNMRLTIVAPLSNVLLYDGPAPKLRSVPYMFYPCYEHPYEPIGLSDTDYDWSAQLISDATFRMGYEQMSGSKRLIGVLEGNEIRSAATGEPWTGADRDGYIFTAPDPLTLNQGIREFQGTGLPAAWPMWLDKVQNVLTRDLGTSDIDMGAEMSKRIPVGTIEEMVRQAEIPVAKHIEKLQSARSIFLSVVLDYAIATGADEKVMGYTSDDGTYALKRLRYSDVPAAHVICTSSPRAKKMALDEVQALDLVLSAPPWKRAFLCEELGVNKARLQKLEMAQAKFEQSQQAAVQANQAAAPSPGGGPGGQGMGPLPTQGMGMGPAQPPPNMAMNGGPMVGPPMQ